MTNILVTLSANPIVKVDENNLVIPRSALILKFPEGFFFLCQYSPSIFR